ncbi:MAG TPA: hypothetical protein VHC22_30620 [Pirellulales bacterium]|nr:hypothetical protein [Pirellulales bacterium]
MFDPYRKWLGIPEGQRPPTHYQLLGIGNDETDQEVIKTAVLRQSAFVRNFQAGAHSEDATRLLNEIAAAKACLSDPKKRAAYDAELRQNAAKANPQPPAPAPAPDRPAARQSPASSAPASSGVGMPAVRATNPAPRPVRQPYSAPGVGLSGTRPRPQTDVLGPPSHRLPDDVPWAQPVAVAGPALEITTQTKQGIPPVWIALIMLGLALPISLAVMILGSNGHSDDAVAVAPNDSAASPVVAPPVGSTPFTIQFPTNKERAVPSETVRPAPVVQSPTVFTPPVTVSESPETVSEAPDSDDEESPFKPATAGAGPPRASSRQKNPQEAFDEFTKRMRERQQRQRNAPPGTPGPFGKPREVGRDTLFVGHDGGGSRRVVQAGSLLYGLECEMGEWGREKCISNVEPLFSRSPIGRYRVSAVAPEGYAVGGMKVRSLSYVNALQLIYMRIKDDGQLDPDDSRTSEWLGFRVGKVFTVSGEGAPVIGIHKRQGLILDALALVVDDSKAGENDGK